MSAITDMEALIQMLAEMFECPSTAVARKLLSYGIRSWMDFQNKVNEVSLVILEEYTEFVSTRK